MPHRELAQLRLQGGAAAQAQGQQASEQAAALDARAAHAEADAAALRERLDQTSGELSASVLERLSCSGCQVTPQVPEPLRRCGRAVEPDLR